MALDNIALRYNTYVHVCCSVSQCVAVCCSVSQCVAVCCSVLQCVAVYRSVLQCVAVYCSVLQCVAVNCSESQCVAVCCSLLQCVAYTHMALDLAALRYNKHVKRDLYERQINIRDKYMYKETCICKKRFTESSPDAYAKKDIHM